MALKVGDNFSYQGAKPNFERDTFATLSAMKSFPTTSIDEGHISLVLETGKRYKYSASNTVDDTLGKWRLVVDTALDATSENPVQNKVIYNKFRSDEESAAQAMALLSQNSTNALNQAKEFLLGEDTRQREEIEEEIIENEKTTAAAIGELKEAIEINELVTAQALNDKVGQGRTINGYDLSEDIILTKADVGLDRVDNTADEDKPISNLTQEALNGKVDAMEGYSLMSTSEHNKLGALPTKAELDATLQSAAGNLTGHTEDKNNPHEVTAEQVGLGNVDNTSDEDKPVSTAQQAALDEKVDKTLRINGYALSDGDVNLDKSDIGLGNVDNTADIDKPVSTAQREALEQVEKTAASALIELREDLDESNEVTAAALGNLNRTAEIINNLTINGHSVLEGPIELSKEDVGLGNVENTSGSNLPVSEAMQQALDEKVDKTITINTHALSENVILSATDIGLGNVDNTSDADKPISTATQSALDNKVDKTTTVNGHALSENVIVTLSDLGLGNLETVVTNGQVVSTIGDVSDNLINHKNATNNPHGVTKTQVGLGNVDNTSDADKPISTATQTALNGKVDNTTTVNGHALSSNVTVTKGDVGLGNADNTADLDKPISNATKEVILDNERTTAQALSEIESTVDQIEKTIAAALNAMSIQMQKNCTVWKGTQDLYDAMETKDEDTLYVIVPGTSLPVNNGGGEEVTPPEEGG